MGSIFKNNVARFRCLKYNPAPTIAPTVTWLVDWGILRILARKRLNVAAPKIIKAASKLINPGGNNCLPRVMVTFLPKVSVPKMTKMLNKNKALFFFINFPPYAAAKEGAMPLAPIFMAKNITTAIKRINLSKSSP